MAGEAGCEWPALVGAARGRPRQALGGTTYGTVYLLSGLLRCPCGASVGHKRGINGSGYGRTGVSCTRPRPPCGYRFTTATRYEAAIETVVLALDPSAGDIEETTDTAAVRAALLARLERVGDRYEAGELTRAQWRERRGALLADLAALPPEGTRREQLAAALVIGQAEWSQWGTRARNAFLHGLLAGVVCEPDRATLCWQRELGLLLGESERVVDLPPHPPRAVARGERHPHAKLDDQTVKALRERYDAGGVTLRALQRETGIPWQTIRDIVRRHTWRHVE